MSMSRLMGWVWMQRAGIDAELRHQLGLAGGGEV